MFCALNFLKPYKIPPEVVLEPDFGHGGSHGGVVTTLDSSSTPFCVGDRPASARASPPRPWRLLCHDAPAGARPNPSAPVCASSSASSLASRSPTSRASPHWSVGAGRASRAACAAASPCATGPLSRTVCPTTSPTWPTSAAQPIPGHHRRARRRRGPAPGPHIDSSSAGAQGGASWRPGPDLCARLGSGGRHVCGERRR